MPWEESTSPEELISAMKEKYIHFSDGWWNHITSDVNNRYVLYASALKLGIYRQLMTVSRYKLMVLALLLTMLTRLII